MGANNCPENVSSLLFLSSKEIEWRGNEKDTQRDERGACLGVQRKNLEYRV